MLNWLYVQQSTSSSSFERGKKSTQRKYCSTFHSSPSSNRDNFTDGWHTHYRNKIEDTVRYKIRGNFVYINDNWFDFIIENIALRFKYIRQVFHRNFIIAYSILFEYFERGGKCDEKKGKTQIGKLYSRKARYHKSYGRSFFFFLSFSSFVVTTIHGNNNTREQLCFG